MTSTDTDQKQNEQAHRDEAIATALNQLGAALKATVASGKQRAWAGAIGDALTSLDKPLRESLTDMHDELFRAIIEQDDGLLRRVEQLKEADAEILVSLDELQRRTEIVIHNDNQQIMADATKLTTDGETFLARIRVHRDEVTTCLQEAFNRDRGIVD